MEILFSQNKKQKINKRGVLYTFTYQKALLHTVVCLFLKLPKAFSASLKVFLIICKIILSELTWISTFDYEIFHQFFVVALLLNTFENFSTI